MQDDVTHTPHMSPDTTAEQARALLETAGWCEVGRGDWSWALADPAGRIVARVSPFDPAYRLHAEACLAGAPNRWLPRMDALIPLAGQGYVVLMERLWPAAEDPVAAFCAALGIANDSGYQLRGDLAFKEADADLDRLRERILALSAEGARRYRLWGGSDIRPGNVMVDASGGLKLADPVFVRGLSIVQAIVEGRGDLLADFTRAELEAFLTIPPFKPGPETDELRAKLAALSLP